MWKRGMPILVLFFLGCGSNEQTSELTSTQESVKPLVRKTGRDVFCPVEAYNSREDSLCGAKTYKSKRSPACGVEAYKPGISSSCPGYIPADTYSEEVTTCGRPSQLQCKPGYVAVRHDVQVTGVCPPRAESDRYTTHLQCERAEVNFSCRLPEFGVEAYKACRHPSHGVSQYRTCQHPSFGVHRYQVCSFYLSRVEIGTYIREVRATLPHMTEALITSRGNYFAFTSDEQGLFCHIEKYETDPLFEDQIADLKALYLSQFGRAFARGGMTCGALSASSIEQVSCPESDTSRTCGAARLYRSAHHWLSVKAADVANLLQDIVARRDAAIRRELTTDLRNLQISKTQ